MRVVENVLQLVGQTPMLRLRRLEGSNGTGSCAEIWAKLEFLNPGGSVKDRAALGLVLDAERRGVLRPGGTIVEATATGWAATSTNPDSYPHFCALFIGTAAPVAPADPCGPVLPRRASRALGPFGAGEVGSLRVASIACAALM